MLVYLEIPRGRRDATGFFPVTRELRVILDARVALREMKRWPHEGVFPAKSSTCSCLFSAHVENEAHVV